MSESFVFSKILPLYSITNPNTPSSDYLDLLSPFSFFDYIKYIKSDLAPVQINDLYLNYLKDWNTTKENSGISITETVQDRYVELLKEITLNYTTSDEKRFLSNIDFNDETELDIVIPFYSKKLQEICNYYIDKRNKIKFKVQKNKIKGTSSSIEKSIYETVTEVVFSDELETSQYQKIIDQYTLLKDLDIEIEELYDLYTNYLDNDPVASYDLYDVKTDLRKSLYTTNLNSIDANIFINFDKSVLGQILDQIRTFLTEFGKIFTINYNLDSVNLNCKPNEKLYDIITNNKDTASRIVELRHKLIEKYIGSNFHYITTGDTITDVTSGILFKASNPTGNLLNRHFPTTATIEEESDLASCRKIGLFFTPEKNSILYFSVPEKKYLIDSSKLEANKVYIFPDPELYGNTSGISRTYSQEYPIIHISEYSKSLKNKSCFYVEGDINTNPYTQDFYSYYSRNTLNHSSACGKDGLTVNFSKIYDNGIITRYATDIYGNQFALFKSKPKNNLIDSNIYYSPTATLFEEYDGGPITFFENGRLPENTYASDVNWVYPNVWSSDYYYNLLIESGVGGTKVGLMERGLYHKSFIIDGLMIDRNKINTEIFDIILNEVAPIQLYTIPDNTLDGNYLIGGTGFDPSFENPYIDGSIKRKDFDGGLISEVSGEIFNFENQTNFVVNQVLSQSLTLTANKINNKILNSTEIKNSYGKIYIRDIVSGEISHLSAALEVQFKNKYNQDILNEVYNEVLDFNIYNDFLWIRTKSYIIFEKVTYQDTKYVYSGTGSNYKTTNNSRFCNLSNPFIFENRNYAMMAILSGTNLDSLSFSVIPNLYKIDYNTAVITKLDTSTIPVSSHVNDATQNPVKLARINTPNLIYNSRNNVYNIICTIEDNNEYAYIYRMKFEYNGAVLNNENIKLYTSRTNMIISTISFHDTPSFTGNDITYKNISLNTNVTFNNNILSFS